MENITEQGNMPLVWKITPVQQAVYNVSTITTPPMSQLLTQTFCHHTLVLGISSFVLFSSCDGAVFPGREPSTAIYPVCLFLCKSKIIHWFSLLFRPGKGAIWELESIPAGSSKQLPTVVPLSLIIWLYLLYAYPQQPLWLNSVLSGKIPKEYIEILL